MLVYFLPGKPCFGSVFFGTSDPTRRNADPDPTALNKGVIIKTLNLIPTNMKKKKLEKKRWYETII